MAGGATLVPALLGYGLVYELRLMVFPVLVGGLSIYPDQRARLGLRLVELVRYDSGVLLQVYQPAEAASPEAPCRRAQ